MVEATFICVDNSEYARNADYHPTRYEVQGEVLFLLVTVRTQDHSENSIGVLTLAGPSGVQVQTSLSNEPGKILAALSTVNIGGKSDFYAGIQVAAMGLKLRQNRNHQQRILAFVCSPIETPVDLLVRLARRLKKNNVAVDVVNFGEVDANLPKLEAFYNAVNNNDNSHLLTIPPGPQIFADVVSNSPIFGATQGTLQTGLSDMGNNFGTDDPELLLALRLSMEEERVRQMREMERQQSSSSSSSSSSTTTSVPSSQSETTTTTTEPSSSDDGPFAPILRRYRSTPGGDISGWSEEDQLLLAIALSMEGSEPEAAAESVGAVVTSNSNGDHDRDHETSVDSALNTATTMEVDDGAEGGGTEADGETIDDIMQSLNESNDREDPSSS